MNRIDRIRILSNLIALDKVLQDTLQFAMSLPAQDAERAAAIAGLNSIGAAVGRLVNDLNDQPPASVGSFGSLKGTGKE